MNSSFLVENLGGGVVLFKNAISLDWDSVFDIAEELVDLDSPSMYKPAIDPETGEKILSNKMLLKMYGDLPRSYFGQW